MDFNGGSTSVTTISEVDGLQVELDAKLENPYVGNMVFTGDVSVSSDIVNTLNGAQYSTGVISGGTISITAPGATIYSVTAGTGLIVDPDGTFVSVTWGASSGVSHTYLGNVSDLYIDSAGVLQSQQAL